MNLYGIIGKVYIHSKKNKKRKYTDNLKIKYSSDRSTFLAHRK